MASGATLSGTGATAANATLASGGLLSPGSASAIGKLTLGGLTLTGGASLKFRINDVLGSDQVALTSPNAFNLSGTNTVTLSLSLASGATAPAEGTYKLFSYTGTKQTSGLTLSSVLFSGF